MNRPAPIVYDLFIFCFAQYTNVFITKFRLNTNLRKIIEKKKQKSKATDRQANKYKTVKLYLLILLMRKFSNFCKDFFFHI